MDDRNISLCTRQYDMHLRQAVLFPNGQPFHTERTVYTVYEGVTKSHKCARERTYKPDSVPPVVQSTAGVIISLRFELPRTSSDLPEDLGRASRSACAIATDRRGRLPIWPCIRRRLPCR